MNLKLDFVQGDQNEYRYDTQWAFWDGVCVATKPKITIIWGKSATRRVMMYQTRTGFTTRANGCEQVKWHFHWAAAFETSV